MRRTMYALGLALVTVSSFALVCAIMGQGAGWWAVFALGLVALAGVGRWHAVHPSSAS